MSLEMDFTREPRPIHITEVKAFLACRLRWFLSALPPLAKGLQRKVQPPALLFGKVVHAALQMHYDGGVPSDVAFLGLWAQELEALIAAGIRRTDLAVLEDLTPVGAGILRGYDLWSAQVDRHCRWLALETEWEAEVADGLWLTGRFDGLLERPDGLWVLDFKTTKSGSTGWAWSDIQGVAYTHAARKLFGPEVRGVIFRFIRKRVPWPWEKLIKKDRTVTTRSDIARLTTLEIFLLALRVSVKAQEYPEWTLEECFESLQRGEWSDVERRMYIDEKHRRADQIQAFRREGSVFFWNQSVKFSEEQVQDYMNRLIIPAMRDMYSGWIGPTGMGASYAVCSNCQFREVCRAYMLGTGDWRRMLRTEFVPREEIGGECYGLSLFPGKSTSQHRRVQ